MKKFLTICMVLLFAGAAGNVFAQEVKAEEKKGPVFTYGLKGAAFGVTGTQEDFKYDYAHIRVRPGLSVVNENVKAVVTFEIDQNFGGPADDGADAGTDNKVVEVKHAYLEVNNTAGITGLKIMAGLNGYKFPLVVDNDFAMTQAGYDFGMGKVILTFIKIDENSAIEETSAGVKQKTDANVYAVDVPLKFGAIAVRPGLISIKGDKLSTTIPEASLMNYAVNVNGNMGLVGFNVSGAYLTGDVSSTVKTSAYAMDAIVDIKPVDTLKISLFATYASGNDGKDATKDNSYFYNMNKVFGKNVSAADALAGKTSSGVTDGRLFLLEYGYASAARDGGLDYYDVMDNNSGYMSYGVSGEFKLDKLTAFAQFGMASLVEKDGAGKTAIGSEIDLKVSYEVAPKTLVYAEFADIIAGDVAIGQYATAKGAYQVAWGLSTSI